MRHQNWRDLQEWESEGLNIVTTTSNEAAKLFDATLTQLVGWYDENLVNGIELSAEEMMTASPDFLIGRALSAGLKLIGTGCSTRTNDGLAFEIAELKRLITKYSGVAVPRSHLQREIGHGKAMIEWSKGNLRGAAGIWEDILVDHPTDMMALKFVYDLYFYLGASYQIRDCVLRVLPAWEARPTLPLKSYLHGMAAFGLEETNLYAKAEKEAKKGLDLNPIDCWSTHSLAHVYEMEGRTAEGIQFLTSTVADWSSCNYLACHNYWHLGLYHIEQENFDSALQLFDTEICKRALSSGAMLDLVDATSLLYRLELNDAFAFLPATTPQVLSTKWQALYELSAPHLSDQLLGFNDTHFMMACLGSGARDSADKLLQNCTSGGALSAENYLETIELTKAVLEAMILFNEERYDQVVEKLNPIRYRIIDLGGSHAQRDVYNQLLITAAIKSEKKSHHNLALNLLQERKYIKDVTPSLTDRFLRRLACRNQLS